MQNVKKPSCLAINYTYKREIVQETKLVLFMKSLKLNKKNQALQNSKKLNQKNYLLCLKCKTNEKANKIFVQFWSHRSLAEQTNLNL